MFIEVSNENKEFLQKQFRLTANTSPDYAGMNLKDSEAEYRRKVDFFEGHFEPLDEGEYKRIESKWSYMKCDHSIRHFVVHNINGRLSRYKCFLCVVDNMQENIHPT